MVELKGSLGSIGLPAIVQLIGELHHSGSLELVGKNGTHGTLGFEEGRLVLARFEQDAGLNALGECARELADADFHFVEGPVDGVQTLELGHADLQRLLGGFTDAPSVADPPPVSTRVAGAASCPLLGFADDRARHYARPTALHRCFADAAVPGLVTTQEQRELCLGDQYPACPRFRASAQAQTVAPAGPSPAVASAAAGHVASSPPSAAAGQVASSPPNAAAGLVASSPPNAAPARAVSTPKPDSMAATPPAPDAAAVPPGVAARLAALSGMRLAATHATDDSDSPIGAQRGLAEPNSPSRAGAQGAAAEPNSPSPEGTQRGPAEPQRHRPRSLPVLIGGTLLGVLALLAVLTVVLPSLNNGVSARPTPTDQSTQALQPVPTPSRAAGSTVVVAGSTAVATRLLSTAANPAVASSSSSSPSQTPPQATRGIAAATQSLPTGEPGRPVAANVGRSLLELRLADGPPSRWLENPPYAGWADGAYRLQARQMTRFVAVGLPIDEVLSNVIVSATFRKTGGPPGGGYGFIVRDQGPEPRDGVNQIMSAYVFEAGDLGEFGVWRRDGDHWIDLVPWTRSSAVRQGGSPNELSVRAVDDRLVFTINAVEVATVSDDVLDAGGVGMFAGGDFNEVAVDRLSVQIPN